jgi:hypothetical protein
MLRPTTNKNYCPVFRRCKVSLCRGTKESTEHAHHVHEMKGNIRTEYSTTSERKVVKFQRDCSVRELLLHEVQIPPLSLLRLLLRSQSSKLVR